MPVVSDTESSVGSILGKSPRKSQEKKNGGRCSGTRPERIGSTRLFVIPDPSLRKWTGIVNEDSQQCLLLCEFQGRGIRNGADKQASRRHIGCASKRRIINFAVKRQFECAHWELVLTGERDGIFGDHA